MVQAMKEQMIDNYRCIINEYLIFLLFSIFRFLELLCEFKSVFLILGFLVAAMTHRYLGFN